MTRPASPRVPVLLLACLLAAPAARSQEAAPGPGGRSALAARVGDKTVSEAELLWALPSDLRVGMQRAARNIEELQRRAVERLFAERYVAQETERRGVTREALYRDEIAAHYAAFPEETRTEVQHLRRRLYDAKKPAIEELIEKRLLEVAAEAAGLTVEQLVDQQVRRRATAPTPAEIAVVVAYELRAQPDADQQKRDEVTRQVTAALRDVRVAARRQQYLSELRARIPVEILLEPPPGRVEDEDAATEP